MLWNIIDECLLFWQYSDKHQELYYDIFIFREIKMYEYDIWWVKIRGSGSSQPPPIFIMSHFCLLFVK